MRLLCTGLFVLLSAVPGAGQMPAADTFEIILPTQRPDMGEPRSVLVAADGLMVPSGFGMIELRRGPQLVGVFQMHQVILIANRSVEGERLFEVQTQQGSYDISADRMQNSMQNGPILFWVGDELVGAVTPHQVLVVIDHAARIGSGSS